MDINVLIVTIRFINVSILYYNIINKIYDELLFRFYNKLYKL